MKIKNEKLFKELFSPQFMPGGKFNITKDIIYKLSNEIEANNIGKKQFFNMESMGIRPENPDPYFYVLYYGKKSFDWLTHEYLLDYKSKKNWPGLYLIWLDWEGKRWMLPFILKWWETETGYKLPQVVSTETDNDSFIKEINKI